MAKFLFKLGRWSFHHKWIVIVLWLSALAGVAGAAAAIQKPFSNEFSIGGTPSIDATYTLVEKFPDGGNPVNAAGVNVVFAAPEGQTLAEPQNFAAVDRVVGHIEDNLPDLTGTERFGNPVEVSPALQEGIVA